VTTPEKPVVALMAGGSGRRFWPLSRRRRPKQLLPLSGGESLLRGAFRRAVLLTDPERLLVVTREDLGEVTRAELPELPRENLLLEPLGADTAPCAALAALEAVRRYGEAVLVMLPADHLIADDARFAAVARRGVGIARREELLVVLGLRPTRPETQYGYIRAGEPSPDGYRPVLRFIEKPGPAEAERLIESGGHYWNAGVFIWRAGVILDALERHAPGVFRPLQTLAGLAEPLSGEVLSTAYAAVERISVDYAVLERADNVVMLPADFAWDDLGQWTSLFRVLPRDPAGNAVVSAAGVPEPSLTDCERCLVYTESPGRVCLVGLGDAVVVATPDTLLVLPVGRSAEVRALAERFDPPGEGP
jgi:mannose-1-phosphate guanylyltransferase